MAGCLVARLAPDPCLEHCIAALWCEGCCASQFSGHARPLDRREGANRRGHLCRLLCRRACNCKCWHACGVQAVHEELSIPEAGIADQTAANALAGAAKQHACVTHDCEAPSKALRRPTHAPARPLARAAVRHHPHPPCLAFHHPRTTCLPAACRAPPRAMRRPPRRAAAACVLLALALALALLPPAAARTLHQAAASCGSFAAGGEEYSIKLSPGKRKTLEFYDVGSIWVAAAAEEVSARTLRRAAALAPACRHQLAPAAQPASQPPCLHALAQVCGPARPQRCRTRAASTPSPSAAPTGRPSTPRCQTRCAAAPTPRPSAPTQPACACGWSAASLQMLPAACSWLCTLTAAPAAAAAAARTRRRAAAAAAVGGTPRVTAAATRTPLMATTSRLE